MDIDRHTDRHRHTHTRMHARARTHTHTHTHTRSHYTNTYRVDHSSQDILVRYSCIKISNTTEVQQTSYGKCYDGKGETIYDESYM